MLLLRAGRDYAAHVLAGATQKCETIVELVPSRRCSSCRSRNQNSIQIAEPLVITAVISRRRSLKPLNWSGLHGGRRPRGPCSELRNAGGAAECRGRVSAPGVNHSCTTSVGKRRSICFEGWRLLRSSRRLTMPGTSSLRCGSPGRDGDRPHGSGTKSTKVRRSQRHLCVFVSW